MKNLIFIFISTALILYLPSCSGGKDCSGWMMGEQYCNGDSIAFLNLTDSSLMYIDTANNLTFENSNGFTCIYIKSPVSRTKIVQNLFRKTDTLHTGYCGDQIRHCYNYALTIQEKTTYTTQNLPMYFAYKRNSIVTTTDIDSLTKGNVNGLDAISVIIYTANNNYEFPLPFNGYAHGNWKLLDSVILNNVKYTDVYNVYTGNTNPNNVIPSGIYYTLGNKLIGFYLTNGETWNLKK